MIDRDRIVLETTRTRRQRMLSSLTYGKLPDRRTVSTNLGRFIGSTILAAVIGVGCLAGSFIINTLQQQKITQTANNYQQATRGVTKVPPEATVDPRSGYPIDKKTKWAIGPGGVFYDTTTGWRINPATKRVIDPNTGFEVDTTTAQVYPKEKRRWTTRG